MSESRPTILHDGPLNGRVHRVELSSEDPRFPGVLDIEAQGATHRYECRAGGAYYVFQHTLSSEAAVNQRSTK